MTGDVTASDSANKNFYASLKAVHLTSRGVKAVVCRATSEPVGVAGNVTHAGNEWVARAERDVREYAGHRIRRARTKTGRDFLRRSAGFRSLPQRRIRAACACVQPHAVRRTMRPTRRRGAAGTRRPMRLPMVSAAVRTQAELAYLAGIETRVAQHVREGHPWRVRRSRFGVMIAALRFAENVFHA